MKVQMENKPACASLNLKIGTYAYYPDYTVFIVEYQHPPVYNGADSLFQAGFSPIWRIILTTSNPPTSSCLVGFQVLTAVAGAVQKQCGILKGFNFNNSICIENVLFVQLMTCTLPQQCIHPALPKLWVKLGV